MEFDYKRFHIDVSCLSEGGRNYARAKIFDQPPQGGEAHEIKWSGDIGDYPAEWDALEAARQWAIRWCDEYGDRASGSKNGCPVF